MANVETKVCRLPVLTKKGKVLLRNFSREMHIKITRLTALRFKKFSITVVIQLMSAAIGLAQPAPKPSADFAVYKLFPGARGNWAETVLNRLSLEEKIGQLFMMQAYSTNDHRYNGPYIESIIKKYKIGGIIFMQGGPVRQAELANKFQHLSELPLLVAQDLEWGLRMRLDSTLRFPVNLALGAVQDDSLMYRYGRLMAEQCRAVGVHVNFAPVVDVNNNPNNPVIGDRAFGENRFTVARKALLYMRGLQDGGVVACAKHFPGHGDTDVDSHEDLPSLPHTRARLDSLELYPFRQLINGGVQSVMTAHLYVPSIDTTPFRPTTLSPAVVQGLLRDSLHFAGLTFTDAMSMKGITKYYAAGEADLAALMAGNDIILIPENLPIAIDHIKKAVLDGLITEREIDAHVRRILLTKEWLGLHRERLVNVDRVPFITQAPQLQQLRRDMYRQAVVLARNHNNLLPVTNLQYERVAYVQIGSDAPQPFYQTLRTYAPMDVFMLPRELTPTQTDSVLVKLEGYTTLIVGLFSVSRPGILTIGILPPTADLLCYLSKMGTHVAVASFGNPYALSSLPEQTSQLVAFDDSDEAQIAMAEVMLGGRMPSGKLPVSIPNKVYTVAAYPAAVQRFTYAKPADAGMDAATLVGIDTLLKGYIRRKAMPGAALLVMKGNTIVYDKGYGYTDYDNREAVDPYRTVYDLASITKIAATVPAAMKLYEQGKLNLEASIATYLPELAGTPKEKITVRNLLQHDAGLPAFIPFYTEIVDSAIGPRPEYVSAAETENYVLGLRQNLYLRADYPEVIFQKILTSALTAQPGERVVYSDLGMILLARIIERITGERLAFYAQRTLYSPLGMGRTAFAPAQQCFAESQPDVQIPPTEEDKYFRYGRVQGYVHDPTAALLGGYSGHAGLFSNVYDLAKYLLMLKNGGTYGGKAYFKPETIKLFTSPSREGSRRGLGWDKPEVRADKPTPTSRSASASAYGHLGYTGGCVWVDPAYDLVYILLTNRTYPDDRKLYVEESVRIQVMDKVYQSIYKFKNK